MNVLITGGTGFVGHWLQNTQPSAVKWATYLNRYGYECGDWAGVGWDCIIHAANVSPEPVLSWLRWRPHRSLLYVSSGAIYNQENAYADNKRRWERECLTSGADVVIARLFTFFGDHLDDNKAITQFVKAARAGQPLHIWGDGNTVRTYMSGADMARRIWAILLRGQSGEAYDVGATKPVTMLELARMVNAAFGNRSQIVIEGRPEVSRYYVPKDATKTELLLDENWREGDPNYPFEGMAKI